MGRGCGRLLDMLVRDGDTVEDIRIKKLGFPVCIFLMVLGVFTLSTTPAPMKRIGALLCTFGPALFSAGVLLNAAKPSRLMDLILLINTVGLCVLDVAEAAESSASRAWTFVVLILDAALVFNRQHIPTFVIPFILLFMATETVESVHEYGLYDVGSWGYERGEQCNCASPPCAKRVSAAASQFLMVCAVFLFDFHFTRGFANSMRLQFRRMEASVTVASQIASALAKYDVDVAELAITSGGGLPSELAEPFLQLLSNLRSYKAYLPHSCLVAEEAP
eukprot:Hpha_TRINITY_DN15864_c4_g5::TRINITY_DN15864_c4_g5_i3::g.192093::m.192093